MAPTGCRGDALVVPAWKQANRNHKSEKSIENLIPLLPRLQKLGFKKFQVS